MDGNVTWSQVVFAAAALLGFTGIVAAFYAVKYKLDDVARKLDEHARTCAEEKRDLEADISGLKAWREREHGAAVVRKQIHDRTPPAIDVTDSTEITEPITEYHKGKRR